MSKLSKKTQSLLLAFMLMTSVLTYGCAAEQQTEQQAEQKPEAPQYPTHTVKMMVPYPAGGLSDIVARTLAEKLSADLGQPFVAENKTSGGNLDAGLDVVKASDGYAIGVFPLSIGSPEVYKNTPPYTGEDFIPVARIGSPVTVFLVKADSPINNVKDLVAYLKANPGTKYAQGSPGSNQHLCMCALAKNENLDVVSVPFNGDAAVLTAILGGHVSVGVATLSGVIGQLRDSNSGVKAIAIYAEDPVEEFPDLQTFSQQGFELGLPMPIQVLFASKDTPPEVIKILDEAVARVTQDEEFISKLNNLGFIVSYLNNADTEEQVSLYKVALAEWINELGLKQ